MPQGWDGLSVEDWFYRLESVRDHLGRADEEDLQPIYDDDGGLLDPEEVLLIRTYGFRDGGHWEAFRTWGVVSWAAHVQQNPSDLEVRMGGIARERIMREKAAAMTGRGAGGGGLDPVEGVALEQWAHVQAALAGGGDIEQLIAQAGMDRPRWDRVSAEWMQRMTTDTSGAIATAYGNAFAGASQGQYGAHGAQAAAAGVGGNVGAEPIPFEHFVEIQEAQGAAYRRGQDANDVLAHFGLSALDWSNASMYWSKRIQQESNKYHALFTQYSDFYRAKYSG
ncbi:DUF6620 family protein [Streptomyces atratus]|uniref:DUF6620 family protein n=1 Tax=Streptomyces atratus TaxID=1893 RepID=UPI00368C6B33